MLDVPLGTTYRQLVETYMCTISFCLHYPQGTKLKSNFGNLTAFFEDKNMFKRPVNTCLNIYHYIYMIFVV